MLGSMTPLGERGRNYRWPITVAYFVLGSALGGLALGALLGAIGAVTPLSAGSAAATLVILTVLGAALDSGRLRVRVPTVRRQVNDRWLHRYRSWVYGFGFGAQLGLGVVTVVITWAVYLTFAAAFLSRSPLMGGLIGLLFGTVRALPILIVARVRAPEQLFPVHFKLERAATLSRRLTWASEAVIAGIGGVALLGAALRVTGG
jgi:hypothetical protein